MYFRRTRYTQRYANPIIDDVNGSKTSDSFRKSSFPKHKRLLMATILREDRATEKIGISLLLLLQPCVYILLPQSWSPLSAYGRPKPKPTMIPKMRLTTGVANGPGRPSRPTSPQHSNCRQVTTRGGSSWNPSCNAHRLHPSLLQSQRFRSQRSGATVRSVHSIFVEAFVSNCRNADGFRVALLSYADSQRIYASSKSRWIDFGEALGLVMENCVSQGFGGAYLVPRTSGWDPYRTDPPEKGC